MSPEEAEREAVSRFGPASVLARELRVYEVPLRVLLALASLATLAIALWLGSVIATVLPARDPARIPFWSGAALGFLAYSGLSIAYLVAGPRSRPLRAAVLVLSVAALGLGVFLVARMAQAPSGRFEGYLLLMGVLLSGHAGVAIVSLALSTSIARRVAAR